MAAEEIAMRTTRGILVMLMIGWSAAAGKASGQVPDHLRCYKVRDPLSGSYRADLSGLSVAPGCRITARAKLLCVEATKSNIVPTPPVGGTGEPAGRFVCYKVTCPDAAVASIPWTDQFGSRLVQPLRTSLVCAPELGSPVTTTTSTTSMTSTTAPACCGPQRIIGVAQPGGVLQVTTLTPFEYLGGASLVIDAGPADADCRHELIVPPGGFTFPSMCFPALGFTGVLEARGCASGNGEGKGTGWEAASTSADPDIRQIGDTSDPDGNACATLGTGCSYLTSSASAGRDQAGNTNLVRGGHSVSGAPHMQLEIPVTGRVWNDLEGVCPDADGTFDPGTDTLVGEADFTLTLTTGFASADFTDLNGDACGFDGTGPDHTKHCSGDAGRPCSSNGHCTGLGTCIDGPVTGVPPAGPCCSVGQVARIATAGIAFTGGAPVYDLSFAHSIPIEIVGCAAWPGSASCPVVTTDMCEE
jgi:hypothetical protein